MPVMECILDGSKGFSWGEAGACHVHDGSDEGMAAAHAKAEADGEAMMAERLFAEARLRLVQVGDRSADGSVWIQILRAGTHYAGHVGGTASSGQDAFEIDAEMLASLVRGTAVVLADGRFPSGIPVRLDPTHADVAGPACGRIKEVRVEGSALLARVVWTAAGRQTIEAGEYDSVSIEADPPGRLQDKRTKEPIEDWALTGLVITNHPFIAGMAPLAASERRRQEADMSLLHLILPALALAESATDAQAVAAVQALADKARRADALDASLKTVSAERDDLKARIATADAWKRSRMLDDACASGRIAASERDTYAEVVAALGEERANKEVYPEGRVKTAPVSASGASPDRGVALTDAALQAEVEAEARRIAGERGCNLADAYAAAMQATASKHPEVAARYTAPQA